MSSSDRTETPRVAWSVRDTDDYWGGCKGEDKIRRFRTSQERCALHSGLIRVSPTSWWEETGINPQNQTALWALCSLLVILIQGRLYSIINIILVWKIVKHLTPSNTIKYKGNGQPKTTSRCPEETKRKKMPPHRSGTYYVLKKSGLGMGVVAGLYDSYRLCWYP